MYYFLLSEILRIYSQFLFALGYDDKDSVVALFEYGKKLKQITKSIKSWKNK